jgi:hypothetical protein
MRKLILLPFVAAVGACASRGQVSTAPPAECARVAGHYVQRAEPAKDAPVAVASEEVPRLLNVRYVERRLADTARSLAIDTVPDRVFVRYRVSVEGRAEGPIVTRTSGSPEFDQAVVWSMGFARFQPARINRCPVAVWVEQDFTPHFPPRRRRAPARESGVQGPPRP